MRATENSPAGAGGLYRGSFYVWLWYFPESCVVTNFHFNHVLRYAHELKTDFALISEKSLRQTGLIKLIKFLE